MMRLKMLSKLFMNDIQCKMQNCMNSSLHYAPVSTSLKMEKGNKFYLLIILEVIRNLEDLTHLTYEMTLRNQFEGSFLLAMEHLLTLT